ncbi:MAG: cysteine hydrolase [Gemmatimonadaceae bacterium]|nr:cysteine hydrolase [Gemmatimonadaceae bacterium]NUR20083.1 cysteine hydrolase [Gemmatimonadaceae bacterium]NUS96517.1 cysteine hydrolase [Gemmatimonadaceae bacterium]
MPSATHAPPKNKDLHGNVPDASPVVLLAIDVINDLEFEGGEALVEPGERMAGCLRDLLRRARDAGVAVIYSNDNFGRWRSDFHQQVDHCTSEGVRGREIARRLLPGKEDYFVLKPKHSAFFATALDTLLSYLGARTLVLTGLTTDSCILATAIDADMRDFNVVVPDDCVAALSPERHERSLAHLRDVLDAQVVPASQIDFDALLAAAREESEKVTAER